MLFSHMGSVSWFLKEICRIRETLYFLLDDHHLHMVPMAVIWSCGRKPIHCERKWERGKNLIARSYGWIHQSWAHLWWSVHYRLDTGRITSERSPKEGLSRLSWLMSMSVLMIKLIDDLGHCGRHHSLDVSPGLYKSRGSKQVSMRLFISVYRIWLDVFDFHSCAFFQMMDSNLELCRKWTLSPLNCLSDGIFYHSNRNEIRTIELWTSHCLMKPLLAGLACPCVF